MLRSSLKKISSVLHNTPHTSPRETPTTTPRVSHPIHFNPHRVIEVNPNSWLGKNVFDHHIQMGYKNFLALKALMSSDNVDENITTIERFYETNQIFELIERLGTVSYDDFFEHEPNGDVKYNVGSGRAAKAPCYNPNADNILVSQICGSMAGLIAYCSSLASYRNNCAEAVRLTVELIRYVDMLKSAYDLATYKVLSLEAEKKAERQSQFGDEIFNLYRSPAASPGDRQDKIFTLFGRAAASPRAPKSEKSPGSPRV